MLACRLKRLTGCWNYAYCTMISCLMINGFSKLLAPPWAKKFRCIDDIFFIWIHSMDELTEFINLFNTHDNSIKIDCNINETSVDFLDVTIFKGSGFSNHDILDTKVYFKVTDTHELLHKKSFHPKHTFEGILKSQLIRFLTMCNNMDRLSWSFVNSIQSAPRKTPLLRQIS